jgi:hypothetical protein
VVALGFRTGVRILANNIIAEVDRAGENLAKSGKGFGFPQVGGANRRDSMPVMAPRQYPEQYGTRISWEREIEEN